MTSFTPSLTTYYQCRELTDWLFPACALANLCVRLGKRISANHALFTTRVRKNYSLLENGCVALTWNCSNVGSVCQFFFLNTLKYKILYFSTIFLKKTPNLNKSWVLSQPYLFFFNLQHNIYFRSLLWLEHRNSSVIPRECTLVLECQTPSPDQNQPVWCNHSGQSADSVVSSLCVGCVSCDSIQSLGWSDMCSSLKKCTKSSYDY